MGTKEHYLVAGSAFGAAGAAGVAMHGLVKAGQVIESVVVQVVLGPGPWTIIPFTESHGR